MDKWLIKIPTNKSATPSEPSCSASNPTSSKTKKKRKYDESYLQYGFTCSSHNNEKQPVCLICKEVLAAESMKPSKLQRHLNTKHATLSKKPIEYFERLLQTSNKEKNTLEKYVTLNDKYLLASYEVSYLMAKTKKPFTIGEQLLLPAAIRMSEIVHGKPYAAEISKIPLSNDTVSKRISDISNDQSTASYEA
ncbi:zinc finger BED domain-containing protein 5-like [Artemia franciscana]|uniref:zinc finger BED domain-containing protein 5-like n=1 Tax=Artemia franciscana TaxID=6661 RepID=UPI0032DB2DFF